MSKPTVYLAGPIRGLSYGAATDWRIHVEDRLSDYGIVAYSPMRWKDYLRGVTELADSYPARVLSNDHGITHRDRFDVSRCDLVLVNLLDAEKVSIGTVIELGWADAYRKPIVIAMETDNVHAHGMIRGITPFIVPTLFEAMMVTTALLIPESART